MQIQSVTPKIIHFIWSGGEKTLPNDSIQVILQWANANIPHGFEIWLWVDKKIFSDGIDALKETYAREFNREKQNGNSPLISHLDINFNNLTCPFKLKDIEDEGVSSIYVRYEISKLAPNYGASSDLLRYAILYKFGGSYFDSDVSPSPLRNLTEGSYFGHHLSHFLGYTSNSQGTNMIGNDTFICSRSNPLMKMILDVAEKNYLLNADDKNEAIYNRIAAAYYVQCEAYIKDTTIFRTGPGLINSI